MRIIADDYQYASVGQDSLIAAAIDEADTEKGRYRAGDRIE
jgi:hypothetical protein